MAPKNSSSKGDAKYGKKLFSWSKIYLEYSKWCVNVFRTSLDKLEKKKIRKLNKEDEFSQRGSGLA